MVTEEALMRVTFPGEAGQLSAFWMARSTAGPAVLLVHGYASQAADLLPVAPVFADAGWHVMALDLRGHGESDAPATREGPPALARDVDIAIDWLHARDDVTSVVLLGHSMGGSTAILAASDRQDIASVVTVAAVADPTLTRIGFWPAWLNRLFMRSMARRRGIDPAASFAVSRLPQVTSPVMLLHGTRDRIVPIRHLDAFERADPARATRRIPGAGHSSLDTFVDHLDEVLEFLDAEALDADGMWDGPSRAAATA